MNVVLGHTAFAMLAFRVQRGTGFCSLHVGHDLSCK